MKTKEKKTVSGIMLTLILRNILILMFNIPLTHSTDASGYISTDTWTIILVFIIGLIVLVAIDVLGAFFFLRRHRQKPSEI